MDEKKMGQLFAEWPELRQYLEELRRADHARAASSDKLLGYEVGSVGCPRCGHKFDPRKVKKAGAGDESRA